MTTAGDVINRALRLSSVLDHEDVPTGAQSSNALLALNSMLERWLTDGVRLPYVEITSPSQTLNYPGDAIDPITYSLAVKLAAEYGIEAPATVQVMASSGWRAIKRDGFRLEPADMGHLPGAGGEGYNINTDAGS